ncbi:MAG: hypothetical protein KHY00_03985, partial [Firmicutes bacterium]|nr:hypothetical protein [Bacillota bacterium]
FTLIINASKKPLSIDNIPLDDIETAFEGETGASEGCSSLSTPAPPLQSQTNRHGSSGFFMLEDLHGQWYFRAVRSGSHRPVGFFAQGETKLRIFRLNVQDAVPGSGGKN